METSQSLILPELRIDIEGKVVATNLDEFRDRAVEVFNSINTDLQTDQDFADAEESVKWCKEVEDRLKAAKDAALAQTASIYELFKSIDDISESARSKRLNLEKLVKARKEQRRSEIQEQAVKALGAHYDQINETLTHGVKIIYAPHEMRKAVGEAMKGKRTIQSLMDAAHQALTDAKLEANRVADRMRANLTAYPGIVGDMEHLFPDLRQLVEKQPDDFAAAIKLRLAEHEQRMQAKREAEQKAREAEEARKAENQRLERAAQEIAEQRTDQPPPAKDRVLPEFVDAPMINIGDINARLAPISLTAAGLEQFGIKPTAKRGAARMYLVSDFVAICDRITEHARDAADQFNMEWTR